ncbi:Probable RNA-directed DNA polymerase from transposon BS [Eumeta japonica]|uniref:Probable RNA-directed DNA polymerase from transposon BS n=1 Tax=Eumeta variegata TaxID=151549 RepID=A0A4C2A5I7_EUMVA|nr:Probable RNA-directed DNA polymerase from transposon BS [Eumeta japonica]
MRSSTDMKNESDIGIKSGSRIESTKTEIGFVIQSEIAFGIESLKPAASQAMSNYERTGHTVVREGTALYYRRSHCGPINIPPLTNMEATGCRLAMTGHSTLVIVSVLLPTTSGRWSRRASGRFRHPRIAGSFRPIFSIDKSKNAALRRASIYPTPEYRSRARALQREVKARVREFRNESWSDLIGNQTIPQSVLGSYQSAQNRGYTLYPTQKPDNSVAIDDAEIAECLADSIETQCSHASPPRHRSYQSHRGRGSPKTSLEPKDDLAPVSLSEVQTLVKSLNTRRHRASMQVLRLVEYVSEGFETERSTVAVFFDVAKAFDRVWHAANRHFTFRHERTHSTRRLIRAGVPQGSTLSPLLYSAYTNDVPRPSSSGVQLALFADDTALFYGNRNRSTRFTLLPLQRAIDELGQWFRKWRIEVNPDKSAAIQFKYGKIRSRLIVDKNTPNLKMLDAIIPWQRNYKYLGVTLDKNLHFRDHIERVRNTTFLQSKARGRAR